MYLPRIPMIRAEEKSSASIAKGCDQTLRKSGGGNEGAPNG
jgi:hypothetical protein